MLAITYNISMHSVVSLLFYYFFYALSVVIEGI